MCLELFELLILLLLLLLLLFIIIIIISPAKLWDDSISLEGMRRKGHHEEVPKALLFRGIFKQIINKQAINAIYVDFFLYEIWNEY